MTESGATSAQPLPAAIQPNRATREVIQVLTRTPRSRLSGRLLVSGDPGGAFHLANGAVTLVASPGAPGIDTLLLRSGRVSEADWAGVLHSAAPESRIVTELVARALIGAAELRVMCLMAALDGAFAVGMGRIDECVLEHGTAAHHLAAPEGVEPEWLLQESARRIRALGSLGFPISPFRDRMILTHTGAELLGNSTTGERQEILLRTNGRRTPRDISFLLGRSVYAVSVELSRMLGEGLVQALPAHVDASRNLTPAADRPPETAQLPPRPGGASQLPRRERGSSGINNVLPLRPVTEHRSPPPPLLTANRAVGEGR